MNPSFARRPVLGVFLAFYDFYAVNGFIRFKSFIESIDSNAEYIIVCNGEVFNIMSEKYKNTIRGSNEVREFSGWEVGLNHAKENGVALHKYIVIFANDTFCYHNNFGIISRYAFKRTFKRMTTLTKFDAIAGEVWPFNDVYEVDGLKSDCWVATYLFAIPGETIEKIGVMHPSLPFDRFYSRKFERLTYSNLLSDNLIQHLIRWFKADSAASWQNKAKIDTSLEENFLGKSNSIICEKHLSAKIKSINGTVINAFDNKWLRIMRRSETLYRNIVNVLRVQVR